MHKDLLISPSRCQQATRKNKYSKHSNIKAPDSQWETTTSSYGAFQPLLEGGFHPAAGGDHSLIPLHSHELRAAAAAASCVFLSKGAEPHPAASEAGPGTQGRVLSIGLAGAPQIPTPPQTTCTATTVVYQGTSPSDQAHCSFPGQGWTWRGGRSLVWGHGPRGSSHSPQQGHPWKHAGSARGRRQAALGALTMFSLLSIPDLPPAPLISAPHRAGMETAPAPGEVCSPCVYT